MQTKWSVPDQIITDGIKLETESKTLILWGPQPPNGPLDQCLGFIDHDNITGFNTWAHLNVVLKKPTW